MLKLGSLGDVSWKKLNRLMRDAHSTVYPLNHMRTQASPYVPNMCCSQCSEACNYYEQEVLEITNRHLSFPYYYYYYYWCGGTESLGICSSP
jgi:hypothetical protein